MCFTQWRHSRRHYEEVPRPSRPVAPDDKADRWETPRRAPLVPPDPHTRKKAEAHVRQTLRDAGRVESNRQRKRFATSNSDADKIRERALAKATENNARAPHRPQSPLHRRPPPPVVTTADDDEGSAYPAPLSIRKNAPPPPPPPQKQQQQHRAVRRTELGNVVPVPRAAARPFSQSHNHPAISNAAKQVDHNHTHPALRTAARPAGQVHPALRGASSSRPVDQSQVHPALRTAAEIHPALRNVPVTIPAPAPAPAPARPRQASDSSQSSLERAIHSYLGDPRNYADSPCESEVSPLNVTQKLPLWCLPTKKKVNISKMQSGCLPR